MADDRVDRMKEFEEYAKSGVVGAPGSSKQNAEQAVQPQQETPKQQLRRQVADDFNKTTQEGINDTQEAIDNGEINYVDPSIDEANAEAPTEADVQLWKKQFPDCKIFKTTIVETDFVFRTINRAEYKQIAARTDLNQLTREELICKQCVLWPMLNSAIIGTSGAGLWSTLSKMIMRLSGFDEPEMVERLA